MALTFLFFFLNKKDGFISSTLQMLTKESALFLIIRSIDLFISSVVLKGDVGSNKTI